MRESIVTSHRTEEKTDLSFVPAALRGLLERFHAAGYRVWLVGGAIRDHLLGLTPKDWDLATNASPQGVMELFPRVIPVGIRHGTVQIHTDLMDVEVTSYQDNPGGTSFEERRGGLISTASEAARRHQKNCGDLWSQNGILDDLRRRDFTVNALAVSYPAGILLDPWEGRKDLVGKKLRAVENPLLRFREDPLRTLRAARLVSTHGFRIAAPTFAALRQESPGLSRVARERIRDEMLKLIMGARVLEAFEVLRRGKILPVVLPELLEGYRRRQNGFHCHDIYHHILHTVHHGSLRLRVRLAALLHDLAKPRVRVKQGGAFRFHGHAKASQALAAEVMQRWKMPLQDIHDVGLLVENHMLMGCGEWSDAAVRRLISRVGIELMDDLLDLARADRLAHAPGKSSLLELDTLRLRIAEQLRRKPPLQRGDLAIDGRDVMRVLHLRPGPRVGKILNAVQQKVLQRPEWNRKELLIDYITRKFSP
jgi:tRNA nucleotidyltransferase (CCA-adding enzyme)